MESYYWEDEKTVNRSLSEEIYAVVVGIEQYETGSSLNRDGVAFYALDFTNWLLNCNVPKDNIYLFISEWEKDRKRDLISEYKNNIEIKNGNKHPHENLEKVAIKKATQQNVYSTIFKTVAKKNGELLFFYWIGHGYMTGVKNRQLLYSDSDEVIPTFNFSLFLESLLTDTFSKFDRQIFFIDACANFPQARYKNEQHYLVPNYKNKNREQLVFYSSQRGYKAIIDRKIAYFSDVLLTILWASLQKLSNFNINDFDNLSDQIKANFKKKYPEEKNYPVSISNIKPDGSERLIIVNPRDKHERILDNHWDDFITIISQLQNKIIKDLIKQLLLKYYPDPDSIYPDLSKSSDRLRDDNFFYLKEIILRVSEGEKENNQFPVILEFCQVISQSQLKEIEAIKSELNEWTKKIANELNINDETLQQFIDDKEKKLNPLYYCGLPYLIVLFETNLKDNKNKSENKFNINLKPELRFQEQVNSEKNIVCKVTNNQTRLVNENNIYQEIYKLIEDTNRQLLFFKNTNQLTIEFFLPKKYLINSDFIPEVENFPDREPDSGWFGSRYKLVFRSSDRFDLNKPERQTQLLAKWKILEQLSCQNSLCQNTIQGKIHCIKQPTPKYNWRKLPQKISQSVNLNLNCPLLEKTYQRHIESFFFSIWRCGIPFAFWLRGNSLENLKLREQQQIINTEFQDLLTVENIQNYDNLFENIRMIREDAYAEGTIQNKHQEYLGYHLGFLFDNPHRLHSNFEIDWGGDTLVFNT